MSELPLLVESGRRADYAQGLRRAGSAPTGVASGRTGVRAIADIQLRARSTLHDLERSTSSAFDAKRKLVLGSTIDAPTAAVVAPEKSSKLGHLKISVTSSRLSEEAQRPLH